VTRAGFVVAGIVLSATVAVALQDEYRSSAQAQTQTSPAPTIWDHNGSVMYLVTNGSSREVYYQKPRPGMLDAGARPDSLLFRGEVNNGQYLGTAYIFSPHCGQIPFQVKGAILNDDERIVLTGQAPRVGRDCHPYGTYTSYLEFRRLPNEAAQSREPLAAAQASAAGVSKPDAPMRNGDQPPSAPIAQPSVKNETPAAAKDSSAGVADANVPSTPTAQASVTTETPKEQNTWDKYKWGAAIIVMAAWLLIVAFGKILIRRKA
jgi:hypothetical protein